MIPGYQGPVPRVSHIGSCHSYGMAVLVSQRMAQVLCLVKVMAHFMAQRELPVLVRHIRVLVTETARVWVFNLLRLVLTKIFL